MLTGEESDVVIVIIRHCRVGPGVGIFISSSIQWRRSSPLVGGSVYESGHKPLLAVMCWAGLLAQRALGKQVWNFPSVMGCFSFQSGLRCISSSAAALEDDTHTHPEPRCVG